MSEGKTMSNTDELCAAAQQALVAMEKYPVTVNHWKAVLLPAADALRAALAQQPAAPDRWNEGFKHGQWLAKHSAPVVERADSATPVVERGAGNLSDNAALAAPAVPVAWHCPNDPDSATAFYWRRPNNGACPNCGRKLLPVVLAAAPMSDELKTPAGLGPVEHTVGRPVEQRADEILEAMRRYSDADKAIPREWVDELAERLEHVNT